jgi:LysM repeat protein
MRKLLLISILALSGVLFAQNQTTSQQLQRTMSTVAGMRSDLDSANDRIVQLNARIENLEEQLNARERRIKQLEEQVAAMNANIQDINRLVESRFSDIQKSITNDQQQRKKELGDLSRDIRNSQRQNSAPAYTGEYIELPVQPGDTLGKIARAAGVSVKSIMEANGLKDADHLRVGQKLKIPVKK